MEALGGIIEAPTYKFRPFQNSKFTTGPHPMMAVQYISFLVIFDGN
jgi:hypothetical protein